MVSDPRVEGFIDRCSINDGEESLTYNFIRTVVDALYYTAQAIDFVGDLILPETVYLKFPSGVALKIYENSEIVDFRLPEKKFWAIGIWIGPFKFRKALPKRKFMEDILLNLINPLNIRISGSNEWYYYDDDTGSYVQGTSYDPDRYYHILTDGLRDASRISFVLAIIYVLHKMGAVRWAVRFARRIMTGISTFLHKKTTRDIVDGLDTLLQNAAEEGVTFETLSTQIDENREALKDIADRIGLRLSFV
jgi:hypothetical protein